MAHSWHCEDDALASIPEEEDHYHKLNLKGDRLMAEIHNQLRYCS